MACSCKSNSSQKQVTSIKQVVKSQPTSTSSSNKPKKNITTRRMVFRRPM